MSTVLPRPRGIHHAWSRLGLLVLVVCSGAIATCARAADEPNDLGPVVALSPYEVTAASAEFEDWIKVGSPNFIVYTDARAKDALTILQQLEMLHFTVQAFFGRRSIVRAPSIVVLPTARSDWRKVQAKGGVEWRVAMSNPGGRVVNLLVAQYDWQTDGLDLVWSTAASSEVRALNIDMAFWFARGLASFFETAFFTNDSVKIGRLSARADLLRTEGWMEWPRLFAVDFTSPEFVRDNNTMRQYEGQCAAFVQYLLANPDPVWMPRLLGWNAALNAGREPTEELFKAAFEQTWAEWTKTMQEYSQRGRYNVVTLAFPDAVRDVRRTQLGLTTTEMRELFVLTQILNQRVPASDEALAAILARGLKTDALRELLVEACYSRKCPDDALTHLRELIAAGSQNPAVFARAAERLFDHQVPDEPSAHDRIDAETKTQIQTWCRQALALEPLFVDANDMLALADALGPDVSADDLAEIGRICRTLDGNGNTQWSITALALARWRAGHYESARKACRRLLDSLFSSERVRTLARQVLGELPPASVPAEASVSGAPSS